MGQANTHNTNQECMKQQRSSPQRNQEENNQANIIVLHTQKGDYATSEDPHFLCQERNEINWT